MKILVIEDEPGIYKFLNQGLSEEGYNVTIAADGETGLEFLSKEKFDLILLDWMLPGISGLELCKKVRNENMMTPIIFLTAKDNVEDTIKGLKSGANDYIKKPFSFDELLERINVQLRDKSKKQDIIDLQNIRIDLSEHTIYKDGIEVHLTQKEFQLLVYLTQHKGKVCTRKEIIESVWDIHFDYDSGVIDVFINGIRKKLNLDVETGILHTIRGIGYLIKES
ncbi:MAG: response regulator transcription factor [Saprospiraceae bacterium]|nr:response regulator transcription factor [Saprospiraceae bacterium]